MADELTVVTGWSYSKNGRTRQLTSVQTQFDISGNGVIENMQSIGTAAHEALVLGEVGTAGFMYARNSDATNYVEIGYDDGGTFRPFIKLLKGEPCQCFLTAAPYAKANTGACILDYVIVER